jgi:hypothetical protein
MSTHNPADGKVGMCAVAPLPPACLSKPHRAGSCLRQPVQWMVVRISRPPLRLRFACAPLHSLRTTPPVLSESADRAHPWVFNPFARVDTPVDVRWAVDSERTGGGRMQRVRALARPWFAERRRRRLRTLVLPSSPPHS